MNASNTELPVAPEVNSTPPGAHHEQIRRRGEEMTMERAATTARKQPSAQKTAKEENTMRHSLRDSLTKRGYLLLVLVAVGVLLAACGRIEPTNQPPDINSLDVRESGPLTAALSASVNDPDGQVVLVAVDWGDGDSEAVAGASNVNLTHEYDRAQSYTVTVTATDNAGESVTQARSFTFTTPIESQDPVIGALDVRASGPLTAALSASVSDPDGGATDVTIDWGDGTRPDELPGGSSVSRNHEYERAGSYTVTVTATDDEGASAEETRSVTVSGDDGQGGGGPGTPNEEPTVRDLRVRANGPLTASLSATVRDPDGQVERVVIDWGDGERDTLPGGSSVFRNHEYERAGTYTVTVTATDDDGASAEETTRVTVAEPLPENRRPTVRDLRVRATDEPLTARLSATVRDPDGRVERVVINWGDGERDTLPGGSSVFRNHEYERAGTYTVTVTATDDDGASATRRDDVTVAAPNQPPTFDSFVVNDSFPLTGSLNAVASDPDGHVERITVNWGDNSTPSTVSGSRASLTHRYPRTGSYTVTVTAYDNKGAKATRTANVSFAQPPRVCRSREDVEVCVTIAPDFRSVNVAIRSEYGNTSCTLTHNRPCTLTFEPNIFSDVRVTITPNLVNYTASVSVRVCAYYVVGSSCSNFNYSYKFI